MSRPDPSFAVRLAALARMPDPEDRGAARLLSAVVQDWAVLATHPTPTFELEGAVLRVAGTALPLPPTLREALGGLDGALRAHGVGGVRLAGPVDRGAVLALLRGARALPASAPRDELQRWVAGHGGASLQLLPLHPPVARDARAALLPALAAWGAVVAAYTAARGGELPPSAHRAMRALVEEAIAEPRALPTLLPYAPPEGDRRVASLPALALVLGVQLGLGRQGLLDLCRAGFDVGGLPDDADDIAIARAIGACVGEHLGIGEARRVQALWGLRVRPAGPTPHHAHLYARILLLASDYEALTRPSGAYHLPPDAAVARLQGTGGRRHDPLLVQALITALGRYPVGTTVVLDSGEIGVVCRPPLPSDPPTRPLVRVVVDRAGTRIGGGPILDLAQPTRARVRIVATADAAMLGIDPRPAVLA